MAARDHHYHPKKICNLPSSCRTSVLFFSLLSLASLFLSRSLFKSPSTTASRFPQQAKTFETNREVPDRLCDYSDGKWIYDPTVRSARLILSGSSNATETPILLMLRKIEILCTFNSAGFIGDSLNRNMFVSLFCTLKRVSGEVRKWRPLGADRGFTFLQYNLTIAYHRTNLLARYGRWSASTNGGVLESLGYKEGYRVDVDIPEGTWAEALSFHDVLIFNTGHWWWAPSKFDPVKSPMLFFEKGLPVMPPVPPAVGLDMVLKHMVEKLFSVENNGTNVEARLVNQHLYKALNRSFLNVLDITRMTEFRADAHPSTSGGKKHDDCMHWCLPGITDTWNDLFIAQLDNIKRDTQR
ncbi:similar to TRICHOME BIREFRINGENCE-LIKE 13 [Actinidia rufa]|uniref:Similar to TRICHOME BIREFRINGENCE-LIKE 13 n=1 Tax=Actinidia rufa TaxID=165716 RepID=A0A7J0EV61_9ERIC|nr:similar to TRICHOME BIREFRINGENCE-LIKE 13 [Actinidia rufa]